MANRYLKNRFLSYEQEPTSIFGTCLIGATGAVGTTKGMGVASLTRTGTGAYTITLQDAYTKLLELNVWFGATSSGIVAVRLASDYATQTTDIKAKTVKIVCYSATTTAADPANGALMQFKIVARLSSIGPSD